MKHFRHNRLKPLLLLSVVVLLRATIPAGFMPAAAGSGLLFELCPESVSAEFMQFLAGQGHHDHGQMDHGDGGHDNHRCPMGEMSLTAAALDDAWQVQLVLAAVVSPSIPANSFISVSSAHYQSRGPPA